MSVPGVPGVPGAPGADGTAARLRLVGGGPVALACALFLVRRGVPAATLALDPLPVAGAPVPAALAARALALSEGSRQLLERIAPLPGAGRIERVEVSLRGRAGRTRIAATDLGVAALGHVVRYGDLLESLRRAAAAHRWALPAQAVPAATLTVHAEGDTGEEADVRDFGQSALLADVHAPLADPARHGVAYERFTSEGPLALLPLPEAARWTMVWCGAATDCEALRDAGPDAVSVALRERFGDALGPLTVRGPLAVAPLVRRARRRVAQAGEAWIGNAAQTLHPVAGQGLNLGLRDAFELADALAAAHRAGAAPDAAVAAWAQRRRADRGITIALTDLLAASFTWPLARALQSPLLAALDLVPALRRPLAAQLMFGRR